MTTYFFETREMIQHLTTADTIDKRIVNPRSKSLFKLFFPWFDPLIRLSSAIHGAETGMPILVMREQFNTDIQILNIQLPIVPIILIGTVGSISVWGNFKSEGRESLKEIKARIPENYEKTGRCCLSLIEKQTGATSNPADSLLETP